eukprot:CAMPEP_0183730854 /NCGR_PEP_ID=MMETSP0737-20130205/33747_1 /TAXON_ID=385413 /ORGANISM="Thalassiosira miniscula, Strain CCMP1093" /LENGTH=170 /DNA_ID=CAMNT_0025963441 /DNA_START=147 /DNA_END=659 /DNA_ORIENTATION=+
MGFGKINKPNLRSLRRKSKLPPTPTPTTAPPTKPVTKWQYTVIANPKEYSDELEVETVCTSSESAAAASDETDNGGEGGGDAVERPSGWSGWLMNSCWGSSYCVDKSDDQTYQSSFNEDGSGESSQPSLSIIDKVLEVSPKTSAMDDISDVTSAPSISDDESDGDESVSS